MSFFGGTRLTLQTQEATYHPSPLSGESIVECKLLDFLFETSSSLSKRPKKRAGSNLFRHLLSTLDWPIICAGFCKLATLSLLRDKFSLSLMRFFLSSLPLFNGHPKFNIRKLTALLGKRRQHIRVRNRKWRVLKALKHKFIMIVLNLRDSMFTKKPDVENNQHKPTPIKRPPPISRGWPLNRGSTVIRFSVMHWIQISCFVFNLTCAYKKINI